MRKYTLFILLIFILATWVFTQCKKEEIVIVYSEVYTVLTSNTTSTTTDVEGLIEKLTSTTHSEYGFCWDTIKDPTVYKQKAVLTGEVKKGTFKVSLSGLKPGTTYHARAFVKDNKKYIYGLDLPFTTSDAVLPVVSTNAVTNITSVYAISGGNVTLEGDKPVITRGVCYDTIALPTILKSKTIDGWGSGSFTSNLTNLKPSKTYYVRAYAVSEFGVSYGSQVTFTTKNKLLSLREDFIDNTNKWYIGTETYGSFAITGGEYVCAYQKSGYLTWSYINFPDFQTMANSKDFEVSTSIKNLSFQTVETPNSDMIAGLVWDCTNTGFKYFGIKKRSGSSLLIPPTYSYTVGSNSGTYTVWKDYSVFTGSLSNKMTIKKGSGYYYFFINDIQVYKQSYTNITNNGVGFYIMDATLRADYLYIDQKTDKKSVPADLVYTDSEGQRSFTRSIKNQ